MHRIDTDGHVANQFSEGDPSVGQPGTKIGATWLTAVQEEIANAIEDAGLVLSKPDNDQLVAAIKLLAVLKCKARADGAIIAAGSDAGFTTAPVNATTVRFNHARITANSVVVASIESRQGFTLTVTPAAGYVDVEWDQRTDKAFSAIAAGTPICILVKP